MTLDLSQYSSTLQQGSDGIWRGERTEAISYPESGNQSCRTVEDGSFWFQHRNRCITAAVGRFPPGGAIFDVGGGNGFVSLALRAAGHEVVLVEPGLQGAWAGRSRGLSSVVCASLDSAAFKPASIPAIGLFDVVEHIDDDHGFMRHVATVLAPGGRVYLTVPAYGWLWSDEDLQAGHKRRYTPPSLTRLIDSAGLTIDYQSCIFRWLPLPILLLRTLPSLLGIRRKPSPKATARAHAAAGGFAHRAADLAFRSEAASIEAGRSITFGGSLLLVAQRPPSGPQSLQTQELGTI